MGRIEGLKREKRIPLVLDLDDTLVRMVGNNDTRYVPEALASLGKSFPGFFLYIFFFNFFRSAA
jgi:predicted HAD superfamily phosphohydrolase YqeG